MLGRMSSPVIIASTSEDAAAVEAVRNHHAQLAGGLAARVLRLLAAAETAGSAPGTGQSATDDLVAFCRSELLPHAVAEESALYPTARADLRARLLVDAMIVEHGTLASLVDQIATAPSVIEAAATGVALRVLFEEHLYKENDLVLPLLAGSTDVSLAAILHGMHEMLGDQAHSAHDQSAPDGTEGPESTESADSSGGCGGSCGCGGSDESAEPLLDVREVPHSVRHSVIFGALEAVRPGSTLVLLAPHDPVPLLAQLEQRQTGAFAVDYLERGPEDWRLRLTRRSA